MSPRTEVITVYDPEKDAMVPKTCRKLKNSFLPNNLKMAIQSSLDQSDKVRTPVLQILQNMEHEADPAIACIEGNRETCKKYDQLKRISDRYAKETPRSEIQRTLNPPDTMFMNAQSRFCQICLLTQHRQRKADNKLSRRFARWWRERKADNKLSRRFARWRRE